MSRETKYIAFGAGGAFQNIVRSGLLPFTVAYAVDEEFQGDDFMGIPVFPPARLETETKKDVTVVLFTMNNGVFRRLRAKLIQDGFPPENIAYYCDFFIDGFCERLSRFGIEITRASYEFVRTLSLVTNIESQSSALGSALLLSLIKATRPLGGPIVELGVFRGGNVVMTNLACMMEGIQRSYYAIDSFEGFPQFSPHDPAAAAGMFRDNSYQEVMETLSLFKLVTVYRGYIPAVFKNIPEQSYSVVYYDCDLYEPALDSLAYFFPRLPPGGMMMFHDYLPKLGGFDGVRLAVDKFLKDHPGIDRIEIPETTHLVIRKK